MSTLGPLPPPPPLPEKEQRALEKKPIPGFVWATLVVLGCAALVCFAVALLLAPHWPPKPATLQSLQQQEQALPLPMNTAVHTEETTSSSIPEPTLPSRREDLPPTLDTSAITEFEASALSASPLPATLPQKVEKNIVPRDATAAVIKAEGRLTIVLDDMALDAPASARAVENLPAPVTFAFLTYAPQALALATAAHAQGHQIIVHIPMQPLPHPQADGHHVQLDPGPGTLTTADPSATILRNLQNSLQPLEKIAIGANNHMGSLFTQSQAGMALVLTELETRKKFFLDSRTIARTAVAAAAREAGFTQPLYTRDVFLDDTPTEEAIGRQLDAAIRLAQQRGSSGRRVIAIGHPHPATLRVLEARLPGLTSATGITLVPLAP